MLKHVQAILPSVGLLLLLCLMATGAAKFEEEDDVIVLNDDNFDRAVKELSPLFVEFFKPKCGHCTNLAPHYSAAARRLKDEGSKIRLAKFDISEDRALQDKLEIKGVPTMKLFTNGGKTVVAYPSSGDRSERSLVRWLKKRTGPSAERVETLRQLQKAIEDERLVAVGFFKDETKSEAGRAFLNVAAENDNYLFLVASKTSILSEYAASLDSVVIFKQFDEPRVDLEGPITVESLGTFLQLHSRPLVYEYNQENAIRMHRDAVKQQLILFISKSSPDLDAHVETLREVSLILRGKVVATYMDMETEKDRAGYYGVKPADLPVVLVYDVTTQAKYKPLVGHQLTTGKICQFVQNVLDKKLKPFLKSEALPEDWNAKPVTVLVGKNMRDIATDPSKDVFIKFYASWCQHCQNMAPAWQELGQQYAHRSDVIIAEMDAIENDAEGLKLLGFPTLVLFPKGDSPPITYDGASGMSLEDFVNFLENGGKTTSNAKSEL